MTKFCSNFRFLVSRCLMLAVVLGLSGHLAAQAVEAIPSALPPKEEGLGQNARTTGGAGSLPAANLGSPGAVDPSSPQAAQTPAASDPTEDIRGPKALVEIQQPKKPPVALWAGIGAGLLVMALAAWWWRRHARRRRLKSPPEVALAELAELEMSREAIAAETFANRAAQTVRQYIADRFGLAAPRRTTEEFLHALTTKESLSGESDRLRVFLKACDLAKFAAANLDSTQRADLVQAARGFVTATAVPNSKSKAATP